MEIFCTLFDSNYLSRGLSLYQSLLDVGEDFLLYVFAFDNKCYDILTKLDLQKMKVIKLKEFETPALLSVKDSRTPVEYCWTSTAHTIRHVLDHYDVDRCTYLDADLYFYNKPSIIINEFLESKSSVLITEHRYTPKYENTERVGYYNVQFLTFKKNPDSLKVLQWWQDRCIEWCHNYYEDGKMGDQKYLDDWPERFEGIIHVLEYEGGGVAPWNVQQYNILRKNSEIIIENLLSKKEFKLVFYHFHGLRFYDEGSILLTPNDLPENSQELIYFKYLKTLLTTEKNLQSNFPGLDPNGTIKTDLNWKVKTKMSKAFKSYRLINKNKLINQFQIN